MAGRLLLVHIHAADRRWDLWSAGREWTGRRSPSSLLSQTQEQLMRSDIVPGGPFPDYELPDHENRERVFECRLCPSCSPRRRSLD